MENIELRSDQKGEHGVSSKEKIHVFVNRRKLEVDIVVGFTGEQLLRLAGFAGNEWDLLRLQGEGDPTGGEVILFNQTIELKNGDHFRVIPGNRTFGS